MIRFLLIIIAIAACLGIALFLLIKKAMCLLLLTIPRLRALFGASLR